MHRFTFVITATVIVTGAVDTMAQRPTPARVPTPPATMAHAAANPKPVGARLFPGSRANTYTTIQGNALNSTNGALQNTVVRLRDARFGRVMDGQITDRSGMFAFRAVEPGSYLVEVMGADQTVLAASQIISINTGEALTAVVKLPFHIPQLAGLLGNTVPSAAAVTTQAAASGVLATTVTGTAASDRAIY
jgi:hypothetical protein